MILSKERKEVITKLLSDENYEVLEKYRTELYLFFSEDTAENRRFINRMFDTNAALLALNILHTIIPSENNDYNTFLTDLLIKNSGSSIRPQQDNLTQEERDLIANMSAKPAVNRMPASYTQQLNAPLYTHRQQGSTQGDNNYSADLAPLFDKLNALKINNDDDSEKDDDDQSVKNYGTLSPQ